MKRAGFSRLVVFKLKETWALLNGDRRRGGPRRRKGRWAWAKVKLVGVDSGIRRQDTLRASFIKCSSEQQEKGIGIKVNIISLPV